MRGERASELRLFTQYYKTVRRVRIGLRSSAELLEREEKSISGVERGPLVSGKKYLARGLARLASGPESLASGPGSSREWSGIPRQRTSVLSRVEMHISLREKNLSGATPVGSRAALGISRDAHLCCASPTTTFAFQIAKALGGEVATTASLLGASSARNGELAFAERLLMQPRHVPSPPPRRELGDVDPLRLPVECVREARMGHVPQR